MQESSTRRDEIVRLKETGLTYAEIGRRLGISRQWAWAILKWKPRPAKPELESKVMLTTGEAGQLLGLHVNTVRRWGRQGILKFYRIGPRGDRRFKREDVDAFLKEADDGQE